VGLGRFGAPDPHNYADSIGDRPSGCKWSERWLNMTTREFDTDNDADDDTDSGNCAVNRLYIEIHA
jgi:hypothetical protein